MRFHRKKKKTLVKTGKKKLTLLMYGEVILFVYTLIHHFVLSNLLFSSIKHCLLLSIIWFLGKPAHLFSSEDAKCICHSEQVPTTFRNSN
jgi:hypothetical protein